MDLKKYIADIPDFPKPGIIFKDISPLLGSPEAFRSAIQSLCEPLRWKVEVIVGLDARWFIFGSAVAYELWLPFVMIRKPGKLPWETISYEYDLEYGSNRLSIQKNVIGVWKKVWIVDDVLATGGTILAAIKLIEEIGGKVEQICFLISLSFLPGEKLLHWYSVNSLVKYT